MIVQEEIEVLKSIYSDSCISVYNHESYGINGLTITYRHDEKPNFTINFKISNEYPETEKPKISFDWEKNKVLMSTQGLLQSKLDEVMNGNFGEVVIFSLIEAVKVRSNSQKNICLLIIDSQNDLVEVHSSFTSVYIGLIYFYKYT